MGCSTSRSNQISQIIQHELSSTSIPLVDPLFQEAMNLLLYTESLRCNYMESTKIGSQLCGTNRLQRYSHFETIRVLFWAISANFEGRILNAQIQISEKAPFITINQDNLHPEVLLAYQSLQNYLEVIVEGSNELPKIMNRINEIKRDLFIQRELLTSLSPKEKMAIFEDNFKVLTEGVLKLKSLFSSIRRNYSTFFSLIPKIRELIATSDLVGLKAHEEQLYKPLDIFLKYYNQQRRKNLNKELDVVNNNGVTLDKNDNYLKDTLDFSDRQLQRSEFSSQKIQLQENIDSTSNSQIVYNNSVEVTFDMNNINLNKIHKIPNELFIKNKENYLQNQSSGDEVTHEKNSKRYPKRIYKPFKKQNSSVLYKGGIIEVTTNLNEGPIHQVITGLEFIDDDFQEEGSPKKPMSLLLITRQATQLEQKDMNKNQDGLENVVEEKSPKKLFIQESPRLFSVNSQMT